MVHREGSYKITSATAASKNQKNDGKVFSNTPKAENAQGGREKLMSYVDRWNTLNGVGSLGAMEYK